ncbi:unnamed protein product [Rodentolepis nana]|uniref:JmjC domain-containing protein n=1 Tax=Rodentolepis nana TaxID=102285 RepID=A0A0R3TYT4_RODNA|nr:unnamed protein product [Rodentolepis nana]
MSSIDHANKSNSEIVSDGDREVAQAITSLSYYKLQPTPTEANLAELSPWYLESPRSLSTIQRYANYQASSFKVAVKDEKQGENFGSKLPSGGKSSTSPATQRNKIRFATIYDLSNEAKWLSQLWELNRLPSFFKVTSAGNMLAHLGYPLIGVNTIQLNMKANSLIPNARITGHQEGNNMCAVNINVGPGDCEWFAVPEQYWGSIHRLTEHQGLDFLTSSWWPDVEELRQEGIPVYRFLQKPGDLVWLNAGTVFWGQALGWCNNIVWNIGTMTPRQYQLAVERFEYNRLRNVKSAVPMIHLSWQLAKNVRGCDEQLCALIK